MRQDSGFEFQSARLAGEPQHQEDDDAIDLRDLIGRLWRGKWIIVITTLFAGLIGFLLSTQYEPTYTARTKVMFDIGEANIVDVGQSVVRLDDTVLNQVEVLQSTTLIERVIAARSLENNPEFNPALRPPEEGLIVQIKALFGLREVIRTTLQDAGLIAPPPPPPDARAIAERLRLSVIQRVRNSLQLSPVWDTKVIEVAITTGSPQLSAAVANTFAQEYIVDQLDAKLEATREATSWLSDRVEELRLRVQASEEAVEEARAELALEAGQGLDITRAQLEALNANLSGARAELSQVESTYGRLQAAAQGEGDFGAIGEFRDSLIVQQLLTNEAQLTAQQSGLEQRVEADHPARVRVDQQLSEVRNALLLEIRRIVEAARLDVGAQRERVTELEGELRALEAQALEQSQDAVRVRQLEREAEASRALYANFLGRLNETSEQEKLQSPDARVLSPAEVPLGPDTQRSRRTQLLSLVLGAFAGVGLIFLIEKLNNTFRTPGHLEQLTGQNYLGAIPSVGRGIHRRDVVKRFLDSPKSGLAEAVRSLRTSILFSRVDEPPKTVMFTSSVPREGKSTTSMLVAMTSRQMGKSAIIVDCDLRMPSLARLLPEGDTEAGLLSVLDESATLDDAIYKDQETGLHVLMTTSAEPRSSVNAADILHSHKFQSIINTLKESYDLVILDTPPTLVVADARILAPHADAVVYAVRWDKTPRGAVLEGLKELQGVNAPIIGVTYTMLNEARASRYSYEGYSYYRGRYRDYYVS